MKKTPYWSLNKRERGFQKMVKLGQTCASCLQVFANLDLCLNCFDKMCALCTHSCLLCGKAICRDCSGQWCSSCKTYIPGAKEKILDKLGNDVTEFVFEFLPPCPPFNPSRLVCMQLFPDLIDFYFLRKRKRNFPLHFYI